MAAGPVLAAGGYHAVGIASVAATLLAAAVGWTLPEVRTASPARRPRRSGDSFRRTYAAVLLGGLTEVRRTSSARRALMLLAVLMGVGAMDEYVPLLVQSTHVGTTGLTLLVGVVTAGYAVGGLFAGRGTRRLAPMLAIAAACLAAGALSGRPAGIVLVAATFGIGQWAQAAAEASLQDHIADDARATVTSLAGLGAEVAGMAVFAGYALGSGWAGPGPLFALAAVPYLALALIVRRH